MLCSERSLVNRGPYAYRAVSLKCRSWGCDLCQPDRKQQLIALAKRGNPTTFITLTSNPATKRTPAERARALAHAWPIIAKRACKKYGYSSIPYLCVFEATKKGEPHLHILCRVKWIGQRWLSQQMKELTGAPIVDIRQVESKNYVAHYIAKYIGKEPHRFSTCKRYWQTRSWKLPVEVVVEPNQFWSDEWYIVNRALFELRATLASKGYDVEMEGRMMVAMREPPTERLGGAF